MIAATVTANLMDIAGLCEGISSVLKYILTITATAFAAIWACFGELV